MENRAKRSGKNPMRVMTAWVTLAVFAVSFVMEGSPMLYAGSVDPTEVMTQIASGTYVVPEPTVREIEVQKIMNDPASVLSRGPLTPLGNQPLTTTQFLKSPAPLSIVGPVQGVTIQTTIVQTVSEEEEAQAPLTLNPESGLTSADVTVFPDVMNANTLWSGNAMITANGLMITCSGNDSVITHVGGGVRFDSDRQDPGEESYDLSGRSEWILGLYSDRSKRIKMEINDADGNRANVYLDQVSNATAYYRIRLAEVTGIDWGRVTSVFFIAEDVVSDKPTTIGVRMGMQLTPTVFPDPSLRASDVTTLSTNALPNGLWDSTVTSADTGFVVSGSPNPNLRIFGGGLRFDGDPKAEGDQPVDLSGLSKWVIGLTASWSDILLEIKDADGRSVRVDLRGGTGYYSIPMSHISGIDWSRIQYVFAIAPYAFGPGTIRVEMKFQDGGLTVDPTLGAEDVTSLAVGAAINSLWDSTAQRTAQGIEVHGGILPMAGGGLRFDSDDSTAGEQPADLSQLTQWVFGVRNLGSVALPALKLEVNDAAGNRIQIQLEGGEGYYALKPADFSGVDWTQIQSIFFIADSSVSGTAFAVDIGLPAMWTPTATNADFEYRVTLEEWIYGRPAYTSETGILYSVVRVRNVRTGTEYIAAKRNPADQLEISVDVPQNGAYAVISQEGQDLEYFHFATSARGSTLAESNSDFLIAFWQDGIGKHYVIDLESGEAYFVGESYSHSGIHDLDVSPDGKWVIYNQSGYTPYQSTGTIRAIDGTDRRFGSSWFLEYEFTGPDTVRVTRRPLFIPAHFGTPMTETAVYDLGEGTVDSTYAIDPESSFIRWQDGPLVMVSVYNAHYFFDASEGFDRMKLLQGGVVLPGTEGQSGGPLESVSRYSLPGNEHYLIISYPEAGAVDCSDAGKCQTVMLDLKTGAKLSLEGAVREVEYAGYVAHVTLDKGAGEEETWIEIRKAEEMKEFDWLWGWYQMFYAWCPAAYWEPVHQLFYSMYKSQA
ncbi:MAG: hypothetical protein ACOY3K_04140 [Candidatus Omnitrophota bacterium]